jgi:CheY-like chemotaxis protein
MLAAKGDYILRTLGGLLKKEGYSVEQARTQAELMDSLKQRQADLLVADMVLMESGNYAPLEKVQSMRPKLPVILVTGFLEEEKKQEVLRLGIADCFGKPMDRRVFLQRIKQLVDPARRVLITCAPDSDCEKLREQLEKFGYQVERMKDLIFVEAHLLNRPFDAAVFWGNWPEASQVLTMMDRLRAQHVCLPFFVSSMFLATAGAQLGVIHIPADDTAGKLLLSRLAERIGLQRDTEISGISAIQLAGNVDREDILDQAAREILLERRPLMLDLRQVRYLGPYVKRSLSRLFEQAEDRLIPVGVLVADNHKGSELRQWVKSLVVKCRVFSDQVEAVRELSSEALPPADKNHTRKR